MQLFHSGGQRFMLQRMWPMDYFSGILPRRYAAGKPLSHGCFAKMRIGAEKGLDFQRKIA